MSEQIGAISERFVDEDLADHWQVDDRPETFAALAHHIGERTNFRPYFERALRDSEIQGALTSGTVADIGAGVGWTSAIMALDPKVRRVHLVEPSDARRVCAPAVAQHFGVEAGKIKFHAGSFTNPVIDEQVDLVVLCAAFHHCWARDIDPLFDAIHTLLKPTPNARVLIANEHFVDWTWQARRLVSWAKRAIRGERSYFWPGNLRAPDPFDGEHWRSRGEVETIFSNAGFDARIEEFPGDLCLDKTTWPEKLGWHYYYAVLKPRN